MPVRPGRWQLRRPDRVAYEPGPGLGAGRGDLDGLIWGSAGGPPPPRCSGSAAQAAYRGRRAQEREHWPLDWAWWSLAVIGAAVAGAWWGETLRAKYGL